MFTDNARGLTVITLSITPCNRLIFNNFMSNCPILRLFTLCHDVCMQVATCLSGMIYDSVTLHTFSSSRTLYIYFPSYVFFASNTLTNTRLFMSATVNDNIFAARVQHDGSKVNKSLKRNWNSVIFTNQPFC